MDSQQQFEGSSLEDVLRDVQNALGANATIIEANRVRKGGMGGFFAKEVFEVIAKPGIQMPEKRTSAFSVNGAQDANSDVMSPTKSILDLAERINASKTPTPTIVSTQSADFADVLANIAQGTGTAIADRDATDDFAPAEFPEWDLETGAPAGGNILGDRVPAQLNSHVDSDGLEYHALPEFKAESPAQTPGLSILNPVAVTNAADRTREVTARISKLRKNAAAVEKQKRLEAQATPVSIATESTAAIDDALAPAQLADAPADLAAEDHPQELAPVAIANDRTPPRHSVVIEIDQTTPETPLAQLGLPSDLIPAAIPGRDVRSDLIKLLEGLPQPTALPATNGSVVAIVGARDEALVIAGRIAEELGVATADIILASKDADTETPPWLQVCNATDAAVRRRNWWRRPTATIVVVDSPMGPDTGGWTHSVLGALEPTAVWAVVDATRKVEDVQEWTTIIGGIDAIALENLKATLSPVSILQTRLPVARIDGQVASPELWADIFTDRLVTQVA